MAKLERRLAAPHPGPLLKRSYIDPLGMSVAEFAAHLKMDPAVLGAMLEGRASIDVETAVRVARALQLPAERIMQMQVRSDFAVARANTAVEAVRLLVPVSDDAFPEAHLSGRLGRSSDVGGASSLFFQEDVPVRALGDDYAGLHALWRDDRMRVFGRESGVLWTGPILQDFEGRILLPYVQTSVWQGWFAASLRADLAPGAEHAAALAGASNARA